MTSQPAPDCVLPPSFYHVYSIGFSESGLQRWAVNGLAKKAQLDKYALWKKLSWCQPEVKNVVFQIYLYIYIYLPYALCIEDVGIHVSLNKFRRQKVG